MRQGPAVAASTRPADPDVGESLREHADAPAADYSLTAPPVNDHATGVYDAGGSRVSNVVDTRAVSEVAIAPSVNFIDGGGGGTSAVNGSRAIGASNGDAPPPVNEGALAERRPLTAPSSDTWIEDLAAAYTHSMLIASVPLPGGSRPGSRGYREDRSGNQSKMSEKSWASSVVVSSLGELPSRPESCRLVSVLHEEGNSRPSSRGLVSILHEGRSSRTGSHGVVRALNGEGSSRPGSRGMTKDGCPESHKKGVESRCTSSAIPTGAHVVEHPSVLSAFSSVEPNVSVPCVEEAPGRASNVNKSKKPTAEGPPVTAPSAPLLEEKSGGMCSAEYPTAVRSFSPKEPRDGAPRTEDPLASAPSESSAEKQSGSVLNTENRLVAALGTFSLKEPNGSGPCTEGQAATTLSACSLEEPTIDGPKVGASIPAASSTLSLMEPEDVPRRSNDQIPVPALSMGGSARHNKANADKSIDAFTTGVRHDASQQQHNDKEKSTLPRIVPDTLEKHAHTLSQRCQSSNTAVQESGALTSTTPPSVDSSLSVATPRDSGGTSMRNEEENADRTVKQVLSKDHVLNPSTTTSDTGGSPLCVQEALPRGMAAPPENTFSILALNAAVVRTDEATKAPISASHAFSTTPLTKMPVGVPSPRKQPHRPRKRAKSSTLPSKLPLKRVAQDMATKPQKNQKQAGTQKSSTPQSGNGELIGHAFTNESHKVVGGEPLATSNKVGKTSSQERNAVKDTLTKELQIRIEDPMEEISAKDTSAPRAKETHSKSCYAQWMMMEKSTHQADGLDSEHWEHRNFICSQYSGYAREPRPRREISAEEEKLAGLFYETWPFVDDKLLGSVVRDNVKPVQPSKERQTFAKPKFVNDVPAIDAKLGKAPFFVPVAPRVPHIPKPTGRHRQRVINKVSKLLSVHMPRQHSREKKPKPMDCDPILSLPIVATWRLKLLTYGLYTANKHMGS